MGRKRKREKERSIINGPNDESAQGLHSFILQNYRNVVKPFRDTCTLLGIASYTLKNLRLNSELHIENLF